MEDEKIVQLIWDRNENGINELSEKYDRYCFCISERIVHDEEDAKECVNGYMAKDMEYDSTKPPVSA